jgi:magnesium-protoporphyrin O-methyltransferase
MDCCQRKAYDDMFSRKAAQNDLRDYRKKGPHKTTRMLTEAIQREGVTGLGLLDIGGGVGAVQHALLEAGAGHAVAVEYSTAFFEAAQEEARRRGLAGRVSFHHGNFVELAGDIPPADIVTLDKVICCYPDMENLVSLSADKARRIYGLVYPRSAWWLGIFEVLENLFYRLTRNPFRVFMHSPQAVEAILARKGFTRRFFRQGLVWQVAVFTR